MECKLTCWGYVRYATDSERPGFFHPFGGFKIGADVDPVGNIRLSELWMLCPMKLRCTIKDVVSRLSRLTDLCENTSPETRIA